MFKLPYGGPRGNLNILPFRTQKAKTGPPILFLCTSKTFQTTLDICRLKTPFPNVAPLHIQGYNTEQPKCHLRSLPDKVTSCPRTWRSSGLTSALLGLWIFCHLMGGRGETPSISTSGGRRGKRKKPRKLVRNHKECISVDLLLRSISSPGVIGG